MTPEQAILTIDDEISRLAARGSINRVGHKKIVEALETLVPLVENNDKPTEAEAEINGLLGLLRRARLLLRIAGLTEKAIAYAIALPEDFLESYERYAANTGLYCRSELSFMLMKQCHSNLETLAASDVETIKSFRFFMESGNTRMVNWLKETHPKLSNWFKLAEQTEGINERKIMSERLSWHIQNWN